MSMFVFRGMPPLLLSRRREMSGFAFLVADDELMPIMPLFIMKNCFLPALLSSEPAKPAREELLLMLFLVSGG